MADWDDHPVEILTELLEDVGHKPNFEVLAEARAYMDELVPLPDDLDILDSPSIE